MLLMHFFPSSFFGPVTVTLISFCVLDPAMVIFPLGTETLTDLTPAAGNVTGAVVTSPNVGFDSEKIKVKSNDINHL
jgi:hypothetical protein